MMDGPVFRRLLGSRAPLRFDDAAPYVFRETAVYRRTVAPAGYGDGLSAALFADGGRYVGMLHMSADSSAIFDDSIRDMIAVLGPALGGLCDPTRQTSDSLDDDFCAQIVTPHEIRAMAGRSLSPLLDAQSGIRHVAARFVESPDPTIRGLWPDRTGSWREVVLLRVRDSLHGNTGAVLVGDRPRTLPHGLSRREVDILTRLSRGASNLQIAADLCLAPRTVATHVEHILAKLDCDSRAAAASRATREGLVRLDVPELR
jgi:DNA-binding CsgD family transcriptional regulator